ncbi:hypothetical protein [Salimicrobium flavidum]|uniref:Uncharacterized protein n=1 Tax=Salimicrobium flavidum TaxID=570947 RepID=A0A1N7J837_9BACI|nr:hypothetical protein [Salimicrobium flavidum]SIS45479.1 hypothetical protein SAMN05421687_104114 [Salimicrobium flavidum]
MRNISSLFYIILFFFILMGCQNDNLDFSENISSIEVYEWESEELVATIEDEEFIDGLVKELDNAATESTANKDFASPEFELHFKSGEDTLLEMGYYTKVMNFDVEGRYWSHTEGLMYGVELPLPLE